MVQLEIRESARTSVSRWHFSTDLKGGRKVSHENISGKCSRQRKQQVQMPEVGTCLATEEQQEDKCYWSEESVKGESS